MNPLIAYAIQQITQRLANSRNGRFGLPTLKGQAKLHVLVKHLVKLIYNFNIKCPCHIVYAGMLCCLTKGRPYKYINPLKRQKICPQHQLQYIQSVLLALQQLGYLYSTPLTMRLTKAGLAIY